MRRDDLYVADLADTTRAIREYLDSISRAQWDEDRVLRDAVLYRLLLLGEIASALPESLRDRYPDVAWRHIRAFRNPCGTPVFRCRLGGRVADLPGGSASPGRTGNGHHARGVSRARKDIRVGYGVRPGGYRRAQSGGCALIELARSGQSVSSSPNARRRMRQKIIGAKHATVRRALCSLCVQPHACPVSR